MSKTTFVELKPGAVNQGWRMRVDDGDINGLAQDINQLGLLQPIVVRKKNGGYELIAGARRTAACKQLGKNIVATVVEPKSEIEALKMQMSENLNRKELDRYELTLGFAQMKAVYERLHPETKKGAAGRGRKKREIAEEPAPPFSEAVAPEFNLAPRTIREYLQMGNLPAKQRKYIEGAPTVAVRNARYQECLKELKRQYRQRKLQEEAEACRQLRLEEDKERAKLITLHHGDNTRWMKGEELYELILTDPPYDRERSIISHAARASINPTQHKWDKLDVGWVLRAAPVLTKGGQMLIFCPIEAVGAYELACKAAGLDYRMALVWTKTNPGPAHRPSYVPAAETIVWATKGKGAYFQPWGSQAGAEVHNVFNGAIAQGKERLHPTQKPDWLITKLLARHADAKLGHRVLDPFAGSGTTGVCCKKLGLRCVLIEKEEEYVEMAKARLGAA
jgi:DNA modification methylase